MIDARQMFVHKQAIRHDNQRFFTGRQSLLSTALDALAIPGAAMIVHGDAGVGKTSFAWQLLEILQGNRALVARLNIATQHPVDKYYCVWIQYNQGMVDVDAILLGLLMAPEDAQTFRSVFPKVFDRKTVDKIERTYSLNLAAVKAQGKFTSDSAEDDTAARALALAERKQHVQFLFNEVLARIRALYKDRELIIFIDDFERVVDRAGMGEVIKDTNNARFVIVGTGDTVIEVIADHASSGRKLEGSKIQVPTFSADEMNHVFDRAEAAADGLVRFDARFRDLVVQNSDGYPWVVQLLGYYSVLPHQSTITSSSRLTLSEKEFAYAADQLASPLGDVDRYEKLVAAIGESQNRERVLFALCDAGTGWVPEDAIKASLKGGALKLLQHHLSHLEAAGIIRRRGEQVRFRDPVLRAIVKLAKRRGTIRRS